MMSKIRNLKRWLVMGGCLLLAGCSSPEPPLRLGTNLWLGSQPLYMAQELGYLQRDRVRLIELLSNSEVIRAYRNGALDVASLTLDEVLLLAADGVPAQIVLVTDSSYGADRILARDDTQMQALRGKRIGAETTALGAYMLTRALILNQMSIDQVQVVPLELDRQEQAYRQNEIDAVVTFEPISSRLQQLGAVSVFDSSQIPDEIVDVLVVRPEILERHPEQVKHILDSWFRALDYLAQAPGQASELMAVRLGMDGPQFHQALAGVRIPDRARNRELLFGPGLRTQLEQLSQFMLAQQLIAASVAVDTLVAPQALLE